MDLLWQSPPAPPSSLRSIILYHSSFSPNRILSQQSTLSPPVFHHPMADDRYPFEWAPYFPARVRSISSLVHAAKAFCGSLSPPDLSGIVLRPASSDTMSIRTTRFHVDMAWPVTYNLTVRYFIFINASYCRIGTVGILSGWVDEGCWQEHRMHRSKASSPSVTSLSVHSWSLSP